MAENQDGTRAPSPQHVDVRVMIEAASPEDARSLVQSLLRDAAGREESAGTAQVRGWSVTETPPEIWDSLAEIDRKLEADHEQYTGQRKYLASAMKLLTYCAAMYKQSDDEAKRLANQAFFNKIYIGEDEQPTVELAEPFNALAPDTRSHVRGSSTSTTVEVRGLEP